MAARFQSQFNYVAYRGDRGATWTGRVELIESALEIPLHWHKPRRIAVGLMGDWMHEALPDEARDRILAVMALCPQHTFIIITLTKRWERQAEYFGLPDRQKYIKRMVCEWPVVLSAGRFPADCWPLSNLIIGSSAWDQPSAHEAYKWLMQTPAACRMLSLEPLLSEIILDADWLWTRCPACGRHSETRTKCSFPDCETTLSVSALLDFVIVGGESGPGARPMELDWARSLIAQCRAAHVPIWVKQLCERGRKIPYDQWPEDLKVGEFLEVNP